MAGKKNRSRIMSASQTQSNFYDSKKNRPSSINRTLYASSTNKAMIQIYTQGSAKVPIYYSRPGPADYEKKGDVGEIS